MTRQRLIVGKDPDCHVRLDDPYVSNRHAAITRDLDTGDMWVEDLGSTNGTYVIDRNQLQRRVYRATNLHQGDRVRVGHTVLPWTA